LASYILQSVKNSLDFINDEELTFFDLYS